MIFQKRNRWKISGYSQSYSTLEEAQKVFEKVQDKKDNAQKLEEERLLQQLLKNEVDRLKYEEERKEKLEKLAEDSTPYEIMLAKNICTTCDLEPCECLPYTKKTDLGE